MAKRGDGSVVRNGAIILGGLLAAFAIGILLFNFVLMPRLVQHNVTVRVPHVVGLDVGEAMRSCRQVGLRLTEEDKRHSVGTPPGRVLGQTPAAGASVKRGRTVRVLVSLGREAVSVPDVRGMTLRQATLHLENAKLHRGRVARIYVGATGQAVRASRPHPGMQTAVGDSVDVLVTVGEGRDPFLMPELVGHDLLDMRQLIESNGFRIGRVTYRSDAGVYPGTILQQYPESGSLIRKGESIDLVAATPD